MTWKKPPAILVKSEEETDPHYGCSPTERPIEEHLRKAIVNIDKPAGPTSHQVTSWVRQIFDFTKTGHSGTLDPNVTGVLPIALEKSTRMLQALLLSSKEYVCLMKLHDDASTSEVKKILSYFQGELYQKPPLKSAVKRQLRTRNVYSIQFIEREGQYVLYRVESEAGTYIRKLCHDMGLLLGVGAHMQQLRRTKAGPFTEESIISMHDLKDAYQIYLDEGEEKHIRDITHPMEAGIQHLPKIWVKDSAVSAICHGASLKAPGIAKMTDDLIKGSHVALLTLKDELIALSHSQKSSEELMSSKKGEATTPYSVLMEPELYPRKW
ncbi:RNA-guided pseudouridylation complex pseudouridine synthase subunit Cbf5 [Candidatus Altiarchaeota archaeon]